MPDQTPQVGVGVFVFNKEGKFIMGVRKGSSGSGTLGLPGGHLDFGESFEECASREIKEETNLRITNVRFLTAVNSLLEKEKKHYVTVFMVGELEDPEHEPELTEPDKCEGWYWVSWEMMKSWAVLELQEAGVAIDFSSPKSSNSVETARNKLFAPLLNLIRYRPEVIPRHLSK